MEFRKLVETIVAGNGSSGKCFCFQNEKKKMIAKISREESQARDEL